MRLEINIRSGTQLFEISRRMSTFTHFTPLPHDTGVAYDPLWFYKSGVVMRLEAAAVEQQLHY